MSSTSDSNNEACNKIWKDRNAVVSYITMAQELIKASVEEFGTEEEVTSDICARLDSIKFEAAGLYRDMYNRTVGNN